jgi:predicted metalloprotease
MKSRRRAEAHRRRRARSTVLAIARCYIDTSFFRDLDRRFGAPGDFAQAYVVAHEVGHHVQNILGALSGPAGLTRVEANAQSVQQELQADCLAGMWGNSTGGRNFLEAGDVEEGLRAAAAIGDDRIQRSHAGPGGAGVVHPRVVS